MSIDQFDVLSNQLCWYCGQKMYEHTEKYLMCNDGHMNVWYDYNNELLWEGFRIHITSAIDIRHYKARNFIEIEYQYVPLMKIPVFNVLNYSLTDLEKKIKTYITFS